jgi:hypothetical protein
MSDLVEGELRGHNLTLTDYLMLVTLRAQRDR